MFQKINITLEIVLCLLKQRMHIRALAQALKVPPATVMRKMNDLLDKNIVDYSIEGRNKRFFLKCNLNAKSYVYMAEHYKLTNAIAKYPELSVILQKILEKTSAKPVILFGSYAKLIAKSNSDIDIYINSENMALKKQLSLISRKLSIKLGSFDLSSYLAQEIIEAHVIVRGVEEFYEKTGFFRQAEKRGKA